MKLGLIIVVVLIIVSLLYVTGRETFEVYNGVRNVCLYEGKYYAPREITCSFNQEYVCKYLSASTRQCLENGVGIECYKWVKTEGKTCGTPTNDIECHYSPNFNCPQAREGVAQLLPFGNECKYFCEGNIVKYRECIQGGIYGQLTHTTKTCSVAQECYQASDMEAWCRGINECTWEGQEYTSGDRLCMGGKSYECEVQYPDGNKKWILKKLDCCEWFGLFCDPDVITTTLYQQCEPFKDEQWRCGPDEPWKIQSKSCLYNGQWTTMWETRVDCKLEYGEEFECWKNPATILGNAYQCRDVGEEPEIDLAWLFPVLIAGIVGVFTMIKLKKEKTLGIVAALLVTGIVYFIIDWLFRNWLWILLGGVLTGGVLIYLLAFTGVGVFALLVFGAMRK